MPTQMKRAAHSPTESPPAARRLKKVEASVSERVVVIDYTNWRGRREKRTIRPRWLWFGSTEYHPEPQWLLCAFDGDKEADRDFAMSGIHSWSAPEPAGARRSQ